MIAISMDFGGWDVNNLDYFSTSLRLKSLWQAITSKGLWSHVIISKYMRRQSLLGWIKDPLKFVSKVSHIWNGFCRVLNGLVLVYVGRLVTEGGSC